MGRLKSKDFIGILINNGADASSNLFEATISLSEGLNSSLLSFRITNFPQTPQRDVVTQELPILGTSVIIPVAGSTIKRQSSFVLRVDENYKVYEKLRDLQCVYDNGFFKEDVSKRFNLKIEALKPSKAIGSSYNYSPIYEWDFYDCYITTVSPLSYSFESPSVLTTTVGFIYKDFNEIKIRESSSLSRVTPQGLVQGGISDLRNLMQSGLDSLFD